jgi:AraC-like DNA-binding protein
MAVKIREEALDRPLRSFRFSGEVQIPPGEVGQRLTRVPFLKIGLGGSFFLATPKGHRLAEIGPGDAVLFAAGTFVNVTFRHSCRYLRVTFDDDQVLAGVETVVLPLRERPGWPAGRMEAAVLPEVLAPTASRLLEGLGARAGGQGPADKREIEACRVLLWELADQFSRTSVRRAGSEEGVDRETALILRYIQDQFHQPISRSSVARALGISPGHLGRLLRMGSGKSFQELVSGLRIEQARWLLARSRLTVEEVALRSGFRSANYFAQAFRKVEGVGPREWRRRG